MTLDWVPATERSDLLADPVARAVGEVDGVRVAEIDPELADTAAFCERYGVPLDASANCVVVGAKRGGETRYAACTPEVIIGSGLRRSKLALSGAALASLKSAYVMSLAN
ncbi:hypothetical protein [Nonomuraea glycinis]|uniref:hypothetical protein n=1 Tax=Nonomuraea glycinis TaxID=2047744 RepID=UPI0033A8EB05